MCASPFSLRNEVIRTFLAKCGKYCSERIQIDYIVHAQCNWLNKYGTRHEPHRIVEQKKVEKKWKTPWSNEQGKQSICLSHFFLRNATLFRKARIHMHGWLLTCLNWQTHRWQTEVLGRCQLGMCRVHRYLSSFSAYRRKTWVGAVHTGVHAFCAKIIARYKMRTYVWKLQMSVGLKKVRIKLQLCLKSSILICFWHSHIAF